MLKYYYISRPPGCNKTLQGINNFLSLKNLNDTKNCNFEHIQNMSLTGKLSNQNISNISWQNIYQTRKHKKNIRYNLITYQTLNFLNNCRKIYLEQVNTKHTKYKTYWV